MRRVAAPLFIRSDRPEHLIAGTFSNSDANPESVRLAYSNAYADPDAGRAKLSPVGLGHAL